MKDLAAFFLKKGTISDSQERYLNDCKFYREDLFSDESSSFSDMVSSESTGEMPVETTGIMICSVPNDTMEEEEECYQTPPEEHLPNLTGEHVNEPVEQVGETLVSVDLAKDTDLLFSDGKTLSGKNISTLIVSDSQESQDLGLESVKNEIFKGKSPLLEVLSTPKLKRLDFDLNDGLDSQIGNDLLFAKDSEDIEVVEASCEEDDQPNEENFGNGTTMELDKSEANNSIPPEPALVPGSVSESRKLPNWVDKLVVEQQGTSRPRPRPNIGDECVEGGEGLVGSPGEDVSRGRGVRLGGRGSSAQGEMSGLNANSSPSGRVAEASNVEVPVKPFVTLEDLMDPLEDDDILVAAIKAGWKFPRPRGWGPEGPSWKIVPKR